MKIAVGALARKRLGRDLLCELANLREDRLADFRRKWERWYGGYEDAELIRYRDELRRLWLEKSHRLRRIWQRILSGNTPLETDGSISDPELLGLPRNAPWLEDSYEKERPQQSIASYICTKWLSRERSAFFARWEKMLVLPNPCSLPTVLAVTAVSFSRNFGFCEKPSCPAPYFLTSRKTQKVCGDDKCVQWKQKKHKLNWWREHGKEWRQNRKHGKRRKGGR